MISKAAFTTYLILFRMATPTACVAGEFCYSQHLGLFFRSRTSVVSKVKTHACGVYLSSILALAVVVAVVVVVVVVIVIW